jgi:dTDP-4-amino-4,6-dideoxygalactose transaminase
MVKRRGTKNQMIPILDLTKQYRRLRPEIERAVGDVFGSGHYINGPNVQALEAEIAEYVGTRSAVALNSGTDALHLALRALDIGPGDEVITTPFSFVATTEAIGMVGATPVFADIDPRTFNVDPDAVAASITPRTMAIMPVHLYGHPAPMGRILELASKHGLAVVEDCAQAIGAEVDGKRVGSFGDLGAFSFFPSKNLGAYGDGGMITTDSRDLAERIRSLRAHGGRVKYHHEELGVNSRLDEVQAAILRVKFPYLEGWIEARREHARRYTSVLAAAVLTPHEAPGVRHVYHQYTIRVSERDRVQRALADAQIQTMVYYPVPLHLQEVHAALGFSEGSFPHAERAACDVLSIPMFPELEPSQLAEVMQTLSKIAEAVAV